MKRVSLLLALLVTIGLRPIVGSADNTLNSVLQRIRIQQGQHFSYHQTRHLQLLSEPWNASGEMYLSPKTMLISQKTPVETSTIISANHLIHINPEQNVHRKLTLDRPYAVPGMEPFMQLLYIPSGHEQLMNDYFITLKNEQRRWLIVMKPKKQLDTKIVELRLSGIQAEGPDNLHVLNKDGDRTEWQLTLLAKGSSAEIDLQKTLDLLSTH